MLFMSGKDVERQYPTVEQVHLIEARGPWLTKSGGDLMVSLALPLEQISMGFLNYDLEELSRIPEDIRGLRIYTVRGLSTGRIGGTEFHRIRQEYIQVLEGATSWEFEDLYGEKSTCILQGARSVYIPPFILHTYQVLEEGSGITVLANTLFNPENPATQDTYSKDIFSSYQRELNS